MGCPDEHPSLKPVCREGSGGSEQSGYREPLLAPLPGPVTESAQRNQAELFS